MMEPEETILLKRIGFIKIDYGGLSVGGEILFCERTLTYLLEGRTFRFEWIVDRYVHSLL